MRVYQVAEKVIAGFHQVIPVQTGFKEFQRVSGYRLRGYDNYDEGGIREKRRAGFESPALEIKLVCPLIAKGNP
jgi:hypothetical protein